jgi:cytochrome c2
MIRKCFIILNIFLFLLLFFITLKRVEIYIKTSEKNQKSINIYKSPLNNNPDIKGIKRRTFNNINLKLFKEGGSLFKKLDCILCHRIDGRGGIVGPDLSYIGSKRDYKYLFMWIKNPQSIKFNTKMPNLYLSDKEAKAIAYYLSKFK